MAKVSIRRSTSRPMAQCENCDRLSINATRERVRRHVQQTGHTAWVVVEDQTQYSPQEDGNSDR
ncbi:hypothetical protein AB0L22_08665 [Micromonospora haikouensis]|uniref:hypothetical protein n=1 Tax=Micromonospora haikouensis TaxID=686309 RepID=UPI0034466CAF